MGILQPLATTQDDSSAGPSSQSYETPFELSESIIFDVPTGPVSFEASVTTGEHRLTFMLHGHGWVIWRRALACTLAGSMPQEGLDEMLVALKDMRYFYLAQNAEMDILEAPHHPVVHGKALRPAKSADLVVSTD